MMNRSKVEARLPSGFLLICAVLSSMSACGRDQRGEIADFDVRPATGGREGTGEGSGGSASMEPDASWTHGIPPLSTRGRDFIDPAGNRVILRGVAIADLWELTQRDELGVNELIELLSDEEQGWYARVIRMTVYPQFWLPEPEVYFHEYLKSAVEYASERGLYVIVDWHEIDDVEAVAERTTEFWQFMAPQFAEYTNVLYEIFNEPVNADNPSWSHWKQYAQPWVDLIRASAPENIILIGGPFWSQEIGGAATDPFVGTNLAYVGHIYPIINPYTWSSWGPMAQVAEVRPLFITEWGFRNDGNYIWDGTVTSFGQPVKEFIEQHGLSWTAWCADSLWGPFLFDADWQLLRGDGEMGGFVQDWLMERKDEDQPARR